jgi:exodeoxyribonuclease V gamma subunit
VEVLHDQLLAWLDADSGLQPQHIMVMVPDMESFAAVIHAAFGGRRDTPRYIPYSVADASPRTLPLLHAGRATAAPARLTAHAQRVAGPVLKSPPVPARFELTRSRCGTAADPHSMRPSCVGAAMRAPPAAGLTSA